MKTEPIENGEVKPASDQRSDREAAAYKREDEAVSALSRLLRNESEAGGGQASLTSRALGAEGKIFFGIKEGNCYFWTGEGALKKHPNGFRELVSFREAMDAFVGGEDLPQFLQNRLERIIDELERLGRGG